ncbi:MAG: hypothetical protein EOO51_05095 [Flavobacterium sp.]|nr:MAG: hypothetical protein EOO51_05095 [Flavobacterium sp.]
MLLSFQSVSAQVYKFQTTGFSVLERNEKGKWGKWSPLQKAEMVITLDTNKNRIVVYSQEIQLYRIITYGKVEESDTDLIYPFVCKDADGMDFTISIITRKKQGNRKQLYINQKDVVIAYNIVHFPE